MPRTQNTFRKIKSQYTPIIKEYKKGDIAKEQNSRKTFQRTTGIEIKQGIKRADDYFKEQNIRGIPHRNQITNHGTTQTHAISGY